MPTWLWICISYRFHVTRASLFFFGKVLNHQQPHKNLHLIKMRKKSVTLLLCLYRQGISLHYLSNRTIEIRNSGRHITTCWQHTNPTWRIEEKKEEEEVSNTFRKFETSYFWREWLSMALCFMLNISVFIFLQVLHSYRT